MQDWLSARAQNTPDKPFLYIDWDNQGVMYTFTDVDKKVDSEAQRLHACGLRHRQHVALPVYNTIHVVVGFFALLRLGCVVVPINVRLTRDEVLFQCKQSDAHAIVCYDAEHISKYADIPDCPLISSETLCNFVDEFFHPPAVDLETPCIIMYTSGTSGQPKGALLTYGNIYFSAMASAYHNGILPHDRWLCILPLFHIGGLSIILRAVLYGIAVDLIQRFDDSRINNYLAAYPITVLSIVPTMLYRLLQNRHTPWHPTLRLILLGGAAPSQQLVQICLEENLPIVTTYGLTEASSQVATSTPHHVAQKPMSVGKPLLFIDVQIVNPDGSACLEREMGEVLVRGANVMQGYYRNLDATAHSLRDGWLYTGDMGYIDEDGDLFIVQRRSDLIVTGGENVYPAEVEAIFLKLPAIEDVCVVGIPDEEWGQKIGIAIVWKPHHPPIDEAALQTYARQYLAGYKMPRRFITLDVLPKTASGKIIRSAVQEKFL